MMEQLIAALSPMTIWWLAALVIFAVAEAVTVNLISIWFAGGALAALIAAGLSAPLWLQIVLFLVVSGVLLALVAGVIWTARSESGEVIPAGTTITVKRIAGVKAYVEPAKVPAEV